MKRMKLKFIIPYKTVLEIEAKKITAPGSNGDFQILPKHVDGTWTLKAGILIIETEEILYYAINEGVVVKQGNTVFLSTIQAIQGESLEKLGETVEETLKVLNEKERKAREVLIKMEMETVKSFMDL